MTSPNPAPETPAVSRAPHGLARFFSIKFSLVGALLLLAVTFLLPASLEVHQAHQRLAESRRLGELSQVGIALFRAVRNFGYERGRTNVVLNHQGPLAEMAANREFILARRQEGEGHLARALAALQDWPLPALDPVLAGLEQIRTRVAALRQKTTAQMALEAGQRDPALAQTWFQAMTHLISRLREVLEILCRELAPYDGRTAVISELMLTSLAMRDQCAPEMALISGAMLSGKPMSREMYHKILHLRGMTDQLRQTFQVWGPTLASPEARERLARFNQLYFTRYLPLGRQVLEVARTAGPYAVSQKEFLATGVETLEALAQAMQSLAEAGASRAGEIQAQARHRFQLTAGVLLLGLLLIGGTSLLVVRKIITPLAEITKVTRRIARRSFVAPVPYVQREDEVGAVARAVDVLKGNTRQMIADYDALEESKAKLQEAMARVRVPGGLLPICSSCKKIRDDQGYWQQLEVFIRENSEAEFTHGICPECARKLYPDFYKE
ncbi:MAG: HAMP domain-containing protein [Deltaproteobacteria bacterium]|nr:HAMP domain-containing protein [Deltaproteobacteria bacterium]